MSLRVCCVSFVALSVSGCGEAQPDRATVSGVVTYQGKAIEQGDIVFQPTDKAMSKFYAQGKIVNGKYEFLERGPVVGVNRVEVHGYKRTGKKRLDLAGKNLSEKVEVMEEVVPYIPPEFNEASTLTIEISPGANRDVNFSL
jgi:hypothetical protein